MEFLEALMKNGGEKILPKSENTETEDLGWAEIIALLSTTLVEIESSAMTAKYQLLILEQMKLEIQRKIKT